MLNYKIERVLFVILWLALICFFSFAIPPKAISVLIQYQYAASSLILALLIFLIYKKISNKAIIIKLDKYIKQNDIPSAVNYISKAIEHHPNFCWLKVKKLEILILNGSICEYQTYKETFSCRQKKLTRYILMLDSIVYFLQQKRTTDLILTVNINNEKSILVKTYYLLSNENKLSGEALVALSSEIYNTPIKIYRCVSSVVLSRYYKMANDKNNAFLYYKSAVNNAPSPEVEHYLKEMY